MTRQAKLFSFAGRPTLTGLAVAVFPIYWLGAALLIALLSVTGGEKLRYGGFRKPGKIATLGTLLLLIPTIGLFVLSRLSAAQLFDERYLIPVVPGVVLLWGSLLRTVDPPFFRRTTMAAALVASIILIGGVSLIPNYRPEDWRSAVRSMPSSGAALVYSGLVETRRLDWLQQPSHWGYLMAPVLTYRPTMLPENAFLVPFEFGVTEQTYMQGLLDGSLKHPNSITLVVRFLFSGPAWQSWVSERLSTAGFVRISHVRYGTVEVSVFQRASEVHLCRVVPFLSGR